MKPKNAIIKLKPLLKAPSFTSKEARQRGVSPATLCYYAKQGELKRIRHGVYRGKKASSNQDFRWDELIEAVQGVKEGVICLTSALILYHLSEEMPSQFWIAIKNASSHRAKPHTRIVRMRNLELGKTTIKLGRVSLPIFDRERTILDAFQYLGRETALKALKVALAKKGAEKISLIKLVSYAKKLRVKIEPFLIAMTV